MPQQQNIISQLNPNYFWDTDVQRLDPEAARRLIVERVFSLGKIEEMRLVTNYYGRDEVIDALRTTNYLDPKTLNFVSLVFKEPKENFKCYTRKHCQATHWSS